MSSYSKIRITLFIVLGFAFITEPETLQPETAEKPRDAIAYVVDKLRDYDVVFLGTRHKKPEILSFISNLLPELEDIDICIGLEIASDQQSSIDRYLEEGVGLEDVSLHDTIDCPEYRNLMAALRDIRHDNRLKVLALDLPASLYGRANTNRNRWMAQSICRIFDENRDARVLVIVGNLHALKRIDWDDSVLARHGSTRTYLQEIRPEVTTFSIAQCLNDPPEDCDFCKNFSGNSTPVAVDCIGAFSDWKLGVLRSVSAKPMRAYELADGVIVY